MVAQNDNCFDIIKNVESRFCLFPFLKLLLFDKWFAIFLI